jgi:putative transposase
MKPQKGSRRLRKGRSSIRNQRYLITTAVYNRRPLLTQQNVPEILFSSLRWLEGQGRLALDASVVMPDHLHMIIALHQGSLAQVMHSFKSFTAQKINHMTGASGALWQHQYHDHAIREDEDLIQVILCTLNNPVRAGLVKDFHEYPYWFCRWSV